MKRLQKTEFIILVILWIGSISTYSVALLNGYSLFFSDYLGLIGLTITSVVSFKYPDKAVGSILVLLLFGLFNLLSFVYFYNILLSFGFSTFVTPGIQLISLALLGVLVVKKREKVSEIYRSMFAQTPEERDQSKLSAKNRFKAKFEKLTDREIELSLQKDLVPEAKDALTEIKQEREQSNKT